MSKEWYVLDSIKFTTCLIVVFHLHSQVTDVFKLEDYQAALDKMSSRGALKIAIKP